ncbi:Gfo/Idh/MocA family oxidoreductase [Alkalihalobacillus sp. MEB130]|uniref:Gfo/Idh/MocA family protein n=1 Tax=Alkalihalobacillus sp. MEB130 TaxID=2976704 RepID=UPI0028DDD9DE|nr:Gfo/Idh/MocA family oxidoreductase [Alkalihalobacillus sp. MEB130]MDT8861371.1 Gfo/Idh/MocA family oxidoreductase [Alkalihalobacillus sp. MEB130]
MALKVGLIGCGNISGIYLKNSQRFSAFDIVACADVNEARAREVADSYGIEQMTTTDLLSSPKIDVILNLTVPHAHAEVILQAIEQKKHVYTEKPLSVSFEDGKRILEAAKLKNVYVGSAPDTFLGGSIQLAGSLLEQGIIGKPVGATAFMMSRGPESWHPNPEFFYQVGGGPMYDMGPYYITALVSLLGSVKRIAGSTKISFPTRMKTSEANYGETFKVDVPTHVSGMVDFASGATSTITTSFDVAASRTPFIEIYGEKGTISLPDPNHFNQPLLLKVHGEKEWNELKPAGDADDNLRGIGLADMVEAIQNESEARASGQLALHVLEVMHGIHQSSEQSRHYEMETTCVKPLLLKSKYINTEE